MNRVQVFGHGTAEVKIYPLRRKGTRYRSYQVSWYELREFRVESLADENGKKFPGYVAGMSTWIGLQMVNRHSAVRIKDISTATGKGMTDDLAFDALAQCRRGRDIPDMKGNTPASPGGN